MKVYINNYKNHWISPYTILEKIYFWREIDYDEPVISKLNQILEPISKLIQWVWDKLDPKIDYVKIDRWDTWSMDHTLAHIILPMLKQLNATKHGAPFVEDSDVPEELRSVPLEPEESTDANWFKRWNYVLEEMIWSFEQKLKDDDSQFFDYSNSKGMPWEDTYSPPLVDKEGLKKYHDRMQNGFRLFGKYYQNLWD